MVKEVAVGAKISAGWLAKVKTAKACGSTPKRTPKSETAEK